MQLSKSLTITMLMSTVLLLTYGLAVTAQDRMTTTESISVVQHLHWRDDESVVEDSEAVLVRMEHGLAVSIDTSGLEPGDVYTLWVIPFDQSENCSDPCSANDIFFLDDDDNIIRNENGTPQFNRPSVAATSVSMIWGGVGIVDDDGTLYMEGHVPIGDTLMQIIIGNGLTNPMGAEVHLILRTHGPLQPGLIAEQMYTISGGCPDPFNPAPCRDVQIVAFEPPNV